MHSAVLNLTLLDWCIFYLFWLVTALRTKRTAKRESVGGSIGYRLPALLALLLLVYAHRLGAPLATRVIPEGAPTSLAALALSVTGLAFCLWARITLGTNWSSVVVVKQDHELVRSGPYRWMRHPIYTGMIAMFLANALLSGRIGGLLGAACLVASFYLKLLREEKVMRAEFPEQYPEYCRRVKRLIPFVH